jgi:hypothetical protein
MNAKKEDKIEEEAATRENKEPRTRNANDSLTLPFNVDLLTQVSGEEGSTVSGWATDRPTQWSRVFQARSMLIPVLPVTHQRALDAHHFANTSARQPLTRTLT